MKELSIEEKAEAYDEAIEGIQEILNSGEDSIKMSRLRLRLQGIFPELKNNEDEDERIRKGIISGMKALQEKGEYIYFGNIPMDDVFAWLERQKDYIKLPYSAYTSNRDVIEFADKYSHTIWEELMNKFKKNENYHIGCNDVSDIVLNAIINTHNWLDWCEKHKEQKPTDKVEPKFKVGDFLVNDYCMGKVIELTNDAYLLDTGQGIPFSCEHNVHLWTIRDAKDGDVLAAEDKDKIFIYNGKLDLRGRVCAYCGIYKTHDGLRFTECAIGNYFTYKEPYPATKEQRDTLMKAMADAGYTFDFEKKELKLKKLAHQEVTKASSQETYGWSEEDEIMLDTIISNYEFMSEEWLCAHEKDLGAPSEGARKDNAEEVAWLKSLKDRVQSQNKWKESLATADLENSLCDIQDTFSDTSYEYRTLGEAIEFIRCTEIKPQWKPSDEQIKAIRLARSFVTDDFEEHPTLSEMLMDLEKQLKKLKG